MKRFPVPLLLLLGLLLLAPLPAPLLPGPVLRPVAWLQARVLAKAARLFERSHRRWPRPEELLGSLPIGDERDWRDPWGHPFRLEPGVDGASFTVRSAGADGAAGTDDDVVQRVER